MNTFLTLQNEQNRYGSMVLFWFPWLMINSDIKYKNIKSWNPGFPKMDDKLDSNVDT